MDLQSLKIKVCRRLKSKRTLRKQLEKYGRIRWLDVGSTKFDDGFDCLNLWPPENMTLEQSKRFHCQNLLNMTDKDIQRIGKYDLVRLQHVLEHFSFEEGQNVIIQLAKLLPKKAFLLITVPDLKKFTRAYWNNFRSLNGFQKWSRWRIPDDAPASCVFSVHVHQMGYHPKVEEGRAHRWCYDYEGLKYQVERVGKFENIRQLGLFHPLAEIGFTHGRPAEDVCLLAQKS